jgi:hypothetical protein
MNTYRRKEKKRKENIHNEGNGEIRNALRGREEWSFL